MNAPELQRDVASPRTARNKWSLALTLLLILIAESSRQAVSAAQDTGGFSVLNNVVLRDGQAWLSGDQVALLAVQKDPSMDWGRQISAVSVSPDRGLVAITLVGTNHNWEGLLDVSSKSLVDNVLLFEGGIRQAIWSGGSQYLALETSDATGSSGVVVWSREGWTARVGNVIPLVSAAISIEHPEWTSDDSLSVVVDGGARVSVAVEQLRATALAISQSSATIFVPKMESQSQS